MSFLINLILNLLSQLKDNDKIKITKRGSSSYEIEGIIMEPGNNVGIDCDYIPVKFKLNISFEIDENYLSLNQNKIKEEIINQLSNLNNNNNNNK